MPSETPSVAHCRAMLEAIEIIQLVTHTSRCVAHALRGCNSYVALASRAHPHTPYVRNRPLRGGLHIAKQAAPPATRTASRAPSRDQPLGWLASLSLTEEGAQTAALFRCQRPGHPLPIREQNPGNIAIWRRAALCCRAPCRIWRPND
jgi:hypothetical protein